MQRSASETPQTDPESVTAMLAGMLDPVVATDERGTILVANDSCLTVFGYRPEELVGQNIRMLMPEPYRSEHDGYLEAYHTTGRTGILGRLRELPAVRKDGSRIEVELSVSRVDPGNGREPYFCGSFRDITERRATERRLAEGERRFRAIFDGEHQFVGLLEPDGRILEVNRAVLQKTGLRREDVLGRPFWEPSWWLDPLASSRVEEAVKRAARGEFVRFEITMRSRRQEDLTIDFSVKPVFDPEGRVVLLIPEGHDISELKAAQRREIAMLRSFAEIGESASLLAHEIKNPITSLNLALRAVAKQLGEDEREILTDLVERMQKLEKMMRRTLSLTRPLTLQRKVCEPLPFAQRVQRLLAPHIAQSGTTLEIAVAPDCPSFGADPDLLEDVLVNLVRNALDALAGCANARIRLSLERQGSNLRILVEDNGPGIPDSILNTLFRPFVSTKSNGTGLGLALARKTVEAHGGAIGVQHSALGGACFEILLPL